MGLKWAWENCPQAPRVLKMDDDIFVHLFNLHKMLKKLDSDRESRDKLVCYIQKQMPVTRDEGSKWQVNVPEYPLMFYEDYCSGKGAASRMQGKFFTNTPPFHTVPLTLGRIQFVKYVNFIALQ